MAFAPPAPPPLRLFLFALLFLHSVLATAGSLRINVGGPTVQSGGHAWRRELDSELFGHSSVFEIVQNAEIALTEFDAIYRTQRYGQELGVEDPVWGYNISLRPGVYSLTLHFAEIYDGIFSGREGPREFHLAVGDDARGYQATIRDLDIYKAVRNQENSALTKTFTNLLVNDTLIIRFFPLKETPVLNAISAERTSNLPKDIFRLQVNAAGDETITAFQADNLTWISSPATGFTEVPNGAIRNKLYADVDGALHVKQRVAFFKSIVYDVPVPATGVFDVTLMFAENYVNGRGKRVFDIAVGDKNDSVSAQRVTGFDIFAEAKNKMYTPVSRLFSDVAAPSGYLRIELTSVVENALISAFVIERPGQEVFISTSNPVFNSEAGGHDHQSHAVAGKDIVVVDFDDDGFAVANLDSSLSHSHFFEPGPPSSTGKIVKQTWYVDSTDTVLGIGEQVSAPFPVGNTIVRLEVTDNTGDKHSDKVTVVTLGRAVRGVYAYFYDSRTVPMEISANGGNFSKDAVLPQYGVHVRTLEYVELKDYQWFSFMDLAFQARFLCNITVEHDDVHVFKLEHLQTSPVKIFIDGRHRALDLEGSTTHVARANLQKGTHLVEIIFRRFVTPSLFDAMLKVVFYPVKSKEKAALLGEDSATYDASAVQPTIHAIMPRASQLNGGGRFRVQGGGFAVAEPLTKGLMLTIHNSTSPDNDDDTMIRPSTVFREEELRGVDSWTMEFTAPSHDRNETLFVSVKTEAGMSNNISLVYKEDAQQPISFRETKLLTKKGEPFEIARPTSVVLGPDLQLYIGTMEGFVIRLVIDFFSLKVQHKCQSSAPGSDRTVLGLAFNPYDTNPADPRLYISTSTLFWKSRGDEMRNGWANGKIQLMQKDIGGFCLGVVDDVVTGLPVSNYDHGVNGMIFDKHGNLYVAVGSSTNAGVSKPGDALGGVPDSPLSASIVIAYLSKPAFNGTVTYDQYEDPGTARQISGDVDVFASGVRNTYDMVMHTNGEIYATSNSPNEGFGNVSSSCDTEKLDAASWSDQIIHVSRDSYHGHPNRNRGRVDKRQCVFYSGETHPEGVEGVFRKPLSLVESSTDGLIEYKANTFNFQLRGDLFASKFAVGTEGKLFRMKINATTGVIESKKAEDFYEASGLSLEQLPTGAMAMPQIVQGQVLVLSPDEVVPKGPYVTSVFPSRGPLNGGYRVVLTGYNFGSVDQLSVLFDGIEATHVREFSDNGRQIACRIPSGKVAGHITVQVRTREGVSPTIGKDFEYIARPKAKTP